MGPGWSAHAPSARRPWIAELSSAEDESDPTVAMEGFRLLYSSNAMPASSSGGTAGGYDLFVADSREVFVDHDRRDMPALGWSWWALLAAMAVGIVVSIFQAITQINEQTLTFIPKMIAVIIVLVVMAPWMLRILQEYAISIFGGAGEMVR